MSRLWSVKSEVSPRPKIPFLFRILSASALASCLRSCTSPTQKSEGLSGGIDAPRTYPYFPPHPSRANHATLPTSAGLLKSFFGFELPSETSSKMKHMTSPSRYDHDEDDTYLHLVLNFK
eukprot:scaffold8640_cov135-Skeletonema_marinoi.AAC.4